MSGHFWQRAKFFKRRFRRFTQMPKQWRNERAVRAERQEFRWSKEELNQLPAIFATGPNYL
jgi:hypothetical protein